MSTETPKTDAAEAAYETYATLSDGKVMIDVAVPFAPGGFDFARTLERFLAAAESERDAAMEDAERLAYLGGDDTESLNRLRATIDRARGRK